jgi:hypothetical protein
MSQAFNHESINVRGNTPDPALLYGPASVLVLDTDETTNSVRLLVGATEVTCDWTRDFVWAHRPSTLECDDVRLPAVSSTGTLYLSERLIEDNHLDICPIKWPEALPAATEYRPLQLMPTAMTFQGVDVSGRRAGPPVTIDLMDPTMAAPGQALNLGAGPVTLHLSQAAFQRFFKPWIDAATSGACNDQHAPRALADLPASETP